MPKFRRAFHKPIGFGLAACVLSVIALPILTMGPAVSGQTQPESYAGLAPLASEELRALRGGMRFGGIDFEFGAISTVLVDGTPVAMTTFTVAGDGGLVRSLEILDPGLVSEFDGSGTPGGGIVLGNGQSLPGIVISDGNGDSVALAGISPGQIASALLNSAQGRNVHQNFETTITINNYSQIRDSVAASTSTARIVAGLQTSFSLGTR